MDRELDVAEGLVEGGLLTIDEARQFARLGRTTLYELMGSGELQSLKIGSSRRIPRKALVALAARRLVTAGKKQEN
jgi:excisionase family DNA binding protein